MTAVTLYLHVNVKRKTLTACMTRCMKTRKKLMIHNYPKTCSNCDYYIYTDQDYMTIGAGYNTKQWFHTTYHGCKDSQFQPVIHTNRTKHTE